MGDSSEDAGERGQRSWPEGSYFFLPFYALALCLVSNINPLVRPHSSSTGHHVTALTTERGVDLLLRVLGMPPTTKCSLPNRCRLRKMSWSILVRGITRYCCLSSIAAFLTPTTQWPHHLRPQTWNTGAQGLQSSRT